MHLEPTELEKGLAAEIRTLATWLSLTPFVLVFLIVIGRAGMASAQVPDRADTRSWAAADYKPWNPMVIHPVDEQIVVEVRMDQTRFPEIFESPGTAQVVESIESTATPPTVSTPRSAPTLTMATGPQPSVTPTQPGGTAPAPTATWTQAAIATWTATAIGIPSPTRTATQPPTATRTSAAIPTETRTPTTAPSRTPTSTATRTPTPSNTSTRTPTATLTQTAVTPPTSAPLARTYWFYDDTAPYQYMMYPSQPSGGRTTFATDLANGIVAFYSDVLQDSTSIPAGTSTVYVNGYTPSLYSGCIFWRLYAGQEGSWTQLGEGRMCLLFYTDALLEASFDTLAYTFGAGERLMLEAEVDQYLEITWDGPSNSSRLELP